MLFILDRLESTAASVTKSFLLHTPQNPTIVDASHVKVSLCALLTIIQYFRGGHMLNLRSTLFLRFRFLRATRLLGVQSQSHVPRQIYQDPGHLYRSQFLEHGPLVLALSRSSFPCESS